MRTSGVEKLFPAGVHVEREFISPEVASGDVKLPGWDSPGMLPCKQRSRGRVLRGGGAFLKEYVYRTPWQRLRRRLKSPRPFVVLAAARRLEELGVPTPRVLVAARGCEPSSGALYDILATEELAADTVFGDRYAERSGVSIRELSEMLVPVVAGLHAAGFVHGDLSLRNWFRTSDGAWGLIDLDGARCLRRVSRLARTRELARLISSCLVAKFPRAEGVDELHAALDIFRHQYAGCGGGPIFNRVLVSRTLRLANRFRRKYLNTGVLK